MSRFLPFVVLKMISWTVSLSTVADGQFEGYAGGRKMKVFGPMGISVYPNPFGAIFAELINVNGKCRRNRTEQGLQYHLNAAAAYVHISHQSWSAIFNMACERLNIFFITAVLQGLVSAGKPVLILKL